LPKDGVPVSNIQAGFLPVWTYGQELTALVYPSDSIATAPYPYYDRWCDDWNVSTEASTTDTARSFASTAWLAAQTSLAGQPWSSTNASIILPATPPFLGLPVTVGLSVLDTNLDGARIIWEAKGQEPAFGGQSYTFTPGPQAGAYWIEAEVQWPDGRRAFATNSVTARINAPLHLSSPQRVSETGFAFTLTGSPQATYVVQVSTDLTTWNPIATNAMPASGVLTFTDSQAVNFSPRYYRAVQAP